MEKVLPARILRALSSGSANQGPDDAGEERAVEEDRQRDHEPEQSPCASEPGPPPHGAIRIGEYRVYYDVEPAANLVTVRAVGYKEHNVLLIRGEEVLI